MACKKLGRLGLWITVLLSAGCSADNPFSRLSAINPATRKQWADDESQGTTFYSRMQTLKDLESEASRLSDAEKLKTAQQLNSLVREESNPLLRAQAVRVLGRLEHPTAEMGLNMAEADANTTVRQTVCDVRGQQRSRGGLQALARVLSNDKEFDVRMAAARQLRNYRDPQAYQALGAALDDTDPAMQRLAMESLREASGQNLGSDLSRWKQFAQTGEAPKSDSPAWASILKPKF